MSITSKADFFLDFQRFGELKLDARAHSKDAAVSVAQQFEGLFVQQMLAAMRAAAKIDNGQHSSYMDFYREMYDKQLAQTIAGQDRLGVAKLIMRQIPGSETSPPAQNLDTKIEIPGRASTVAVAPLTANESPHAVPGAPIPAPGETATRAEVVLVKVVNDDFAELGRIENVVLVDPLDYLGFVHVMTRAMLIITDSGGIQEEATALATPALVMREVTERPEAVEAGVTELVGTDPDRIVERAAALLADPEVGLRARHAATIYGDGKAAARIADALAHS